MTPNEYVPAAVGVPDITVPDQEAHVGFVTSVSVEDSLTDGVYEYAVPIFPVVLGLFVNVGAHLPLTTGVAAGTITVQSFSLDKVPRADVALIANE